MTAPEKAPLRAIDWPAIRKAYEQGDDPVRIIAAQHGISQSKIDHRRAKEGWLMRRDPARAAKRGSVDWAEVRSEYEMGQYPVLELCERHGFGLSSLYRRKQLQNWDARRATYPKAYGAGGKVNATQRLKALVAKKLAALEVRRVLGEKIDVGDPLKGLHTLASAFEKMLDIEHREKLRDDGDRAGRLIINDASREALARRIEKLASAWESKGDTGRA